MDTHKGLEEQRAKPIDNTKPIFLMPDDLEKMTNVGGKYGSYIYHTLEECLKKHKDVFAWSVEDMLGIDPKVACHKL